MTRNFENYIYFLINCNKESHFLIKLCKGYNNICIYIRIPFVLPKFKQTF